MTAAYELVVKQGESFDKTFTWKDALGTPINLTNYTARAQVRESYAGTAKFVDIDTSTDPLVAGGISLGGTAGTIRMRIPAPASGSYGWSKGVWDMELISSGTVVTRLLAGPAVLSPEVTR